MTTQYMPCSWPDSVRIDWPTADKTVTLKQHVHGSCHGYAGLVG